VTYHSKMSAFSEDKEAKRLLSACNPGGEAADAATLGWAGIFRLGLVQGSLGAVVVLTTATLNRVMVVELALPALLPGALVALHYVLQVLRPRMGFGSDMGGRRTPFIVGGMAALCLGGLCAAFAVSLMPHHLIGGIALAIASFTAVGIGVGAAGTNVLVLMAKAVAPHRRGAAATIVWVMMIFGIVAASAFASVALHPFSLGVLVKVTAEIAACAFLLSCLAIAGLERGAIASAPAGDKPGFLAALREVWSEPRSRGFAIFVFLSMAAYGAQELILEPFAGTVFHVPPAGTAGLTSLQHGGVMLGMVAVGLLSLRVGRDLRAMVLAGCAASACALAALAIAGLLGAGAFLKPLIFALGFANGVFAVSAIGAMMGLASQGRALREGTRMGLWGAAQALAFGAGSILAPAISNALGLTAAAYAVVFTTQAVLFVLAALIYPASSCEKNKSLTESFRPEKDLLSLTKNQKGDLYPLTSAGRSAP
jgi:BCD family chlorophyll transporter-like MFS transporter